MSKARKQSTEAAVREIRRKTGRKFAPEQKIRIVLEGLRRRFRQKQGETLPRLARTCRWSIARQTAAESVNACAAGDSLA